MDNIFKKYYIAMAVYIIPFLIIVICCSVRTDYEITTPGGVSKVDERFVIENGYDSNDLYSLYVYSIKNATLFQNLIASFTDLFETSEINDNYSHMTDDMWYQAGVIQKNQSEEACLINAYEYASLTNENISINYTYEGVIVRITTAQSNVFKIGDILSHVNDVKISSLNQFSDDSRDDYIKLKLTDKLTITRDEEVFNHVLSEGDTLGVGFYDKFTILNTTPSYIINPTSSIGPSAGMMQTLSIYNQLIGNDLTIKDNVKRSIAGTGTIESDGTIGAIGGVTQKVYSAFESGANILIMSKDNEEEALSAYNKIKNKEKMQLIIVNNFAEVIQCLI